MYWSDSEPFLSIQSCGAYTVEEWIEDIDISQIKKSSDYGSYTTGQDWANIIQAVKNDPELMSMEIVAAHVDEGDGQSGGGVSAAFRNPDTLEGVIAFRGTASEEWKDNFIGGAGTEAKDGVSTPCQERALAWYQSLDKREFGTITIIGHSKGGNKAKYITLLDDSVDRCLSFDGQGFSDEFIDKYAEDISKNQHKITNHNVAGDYVNILLNDVGERIYYEGYNIGEGGILENHCPDTYFQFSENGEPSIHIAKDGQEEGMASLDEFLNSYLRSLPANRKENAMAFIGELAEMALGEGKTNIGEYLDVLLYGENTDEAAYLLAYLIEYEQKYPEVGDQVSTLLKEFGMSDAAGIMDFATEILESPYFDIVYDLINVLEKEGLEDNIKRMPDFIWKWIEGFAGVDFPKEDALKLLGLITKVNRYMDRIEVTKDGKDRYIPSKAEAVSAGFSVKPSVLKSSSAFFRDCSGRLEDFCVNVERIRSRLDGSSAYKLIQKRLQEIEEKLNEQAFQCRKQGEALEAIGTFYQKAEERILRL